MFGSEIDKQYVSGSFPKKIVQYWDQGAVPEDVKPLMESWREMNSDCSYEVFDKPLARDFIFDVYGKDGLSVFDVAALPAMRSDIFRVAFMLSQGGIYVDAATRCIAPIFDLVKQTDELMLMRKKHGRIWNGFIAAKKDSCRLSMIWQAINKNVQEREIPGVWGATGPGVYNKIIDHDCDDRVSIILEQNMGQYFKLITGLGYKKAGHWSKVQHSVSIYCGR